MRDIRTPATLTDRYEAARFLEAIAAGIRNGGYDVQSVYESLEITSHNLNGFHINIAGQIQSVIPAKPSIVDEVKRMFHEKHRIHGGYIESLIEEAHYRCDIYFEDNESVAEDAYDEYMTADLVYHVAYRLWTSDGVWDNDWVYEVCDSEIHARLPAEAYVQE